MLEQAAAEVSTPLDLASMSIELTRNASSTETATDSPAPMPHLTAPSSEIVAAGARRPIVANTEKRVGIRFAIHQ